MALADILRRMDNISRVLDEKVEVAMDLTGREFVNNAKKSVTQTIYNRVTGRTPNRRAWELTGNLRNSIQASIGNDGETKILQLEAGMEYAAAVEAKGYDVISGSIPQATKDFDRRLKLAMKATANSIAKL